jgi:hypothetical protein
VAAAATIARPPPARTRTATRWALVAAGCVVLAALSLLIARRTTYDPTAWLIWGREIVHGDLSTRVGPSWKPLPVAVTAPSALLGDAAQQQIWLVVARAGTLAALALAYRLAWRLAGPVAGVIAAGALLVSSSLASRTFRGDSEGLLVAVGFGAVEAHLSGRRWTAFWLVAAATLLRPEMCLLAAGYGLWLVWVAPPGALRRRTFAVAAGAGALVVMAWLIPEQIGSGHLFRAASRALVPVAGSPATAAHPFLATFTNAAPVLPWPLYATGAGLVVATAWEARRRRSPQPLLALALAAVATVLMVVVAAMAEAGFTGNSRYLTIPIALTCVLGAAGFVRFAALARTRLTGGRATAAIALAVVIAAPFAVAAALRTRDQMRAGLHESALQAALPAAIARAGGRSAVLRCGQLATEPFDVQVLARALHAHETEVTIEPRVPGTIVVRADSPLANDRRFRTLARTKRWVVASSCAT